MKNIKAIDLLKKDPILEKIIRRAGKYQIKSKNNYFASLIEAIISQQLGGSAADAILGRFKKLYPRFPKPADILKTRDSKLRSVGLSKMKISYIKDLSKKIEDGEIRIRSLSKLSDEKIIEELTKVKGIGRWTAEMFLIFSCKRLDVWPSGDLGLRKGIQMAFSLPDLPEPKQVEEIGVRWKPYRSVATWYLWKSLEKFDKIG